MPWVVIAAAVLKVNNMPFCVHTRATRLFIYCKNNRLAVGFIRSTSISLSVQNYTRHGITLCYTTDVWNPCLAGDEWKRQQ